MFKAAHAIYFSPTGMTKTYVGLIAGKLGTPVIERDLTGPAWDDGPLHVGRDEIAVLGAPVFSGRIPELAAERFRRIKGRGGPAIIVTSYGNRAHDDALLELSDLAQENGFKVAGAAAPVGRHSLLPHNAADRPDALDIAEAEKFAEACLEKLKKTPLEKLQLPDIGGNRPYKDVAPSPWLPYGSDNCNKCQTCVKLCPVGAIPSEDPRSTADKCFKCGRCLCVCPRGARKIPDEIFAVMRARIDPLASGHKPSHWFL